MWWPLRAQALLPGEIDHERRWLTVTVGCGAGAAFLLWSGAPLPKCLLHTWTGIPCPGCGSTRAFRQFLVGHLGAAFVFNPLATLGFLGIIAFDIYAVLVLCGKAPRLRLEPLSRSQTQGLRVLAICAVAANWWWLLAHGR